MKTKLAWILAILVILPAGAVSAQTAPKIGVVNVVKVFSELQETKDYSEKLLTERNNIVAMEQQMTQKIEELKQARDQLKSDAPGYEERNKEMLKAAVEQRVWRDMTNADVQRRRKQQYMMIFSKIENAVTEIAKQKALDLVISEQKSEMNPDLEQVTVEQIQARFTLRNVLYASESIDFTNEVIAHLDQKYKAGN